MDANTPSAEITAYLAAFPAETQTRLRTVRELVAQCAPQAEEQLSYGMLGYKLHGRPLIYFGGFAHHIGMYATPAGHAEFVDEFAKYKQGKGSVQLPLSDELPLALIRRVIEFRVASLNV